MLKSKCHTWSILLLSQLLRQQKLWLVGANTLNDWVAHEIARIARSEEVGWRDIIALV